MNHFMLLNTDEWKHSRNAYICFHFKLPMLYSNYYSYITVKCSLFLFFWLPRLSCWILVWFLQFRHLMDMLMLCATMKNSPCANIHTSCTDVLAETCTQTKNINHNHHIIVWVSQQMAMWDFTLEVLEWIKILAHPM